MKFSAIIKYLLITVISSVFVLVVLFAKKDIPVDDLKPAYAPPPSAFVSVQGMEIHYRDVGNRHDSIPIVLIHGTGSSLHTFEGWAAELSKKHRVITFDLPGYGLTGPFPDGNYSMQHYTKFIEQFLDQLKIKKCILGGNSLGGRVAWNFAYSHPSRIEKLILIDASGYPVEGKSTPIAFKLAKWPVLNKLLTVLTPRFVVESSVENVYADKTKVTSSLVDRYYHLTLREGNRQAFVDRFKVKADTAISEKIKRIKIPALVLWGEQDLLIPLEVAHQFHGDLPNDTLVVLPGLGHVPMEEDPVRSVKVVQAFLTEQPEL